MKKLLILTLFAGFCAFALSFGENVFITNDRHHPIPVVIQTPTPTPTASATSTSTATPTATPTP